MTTMTPTTAPLAYTAFAAKPLPNRAETIANINYLINLMPMAEAEPALMADWQIAPRDPSWCYGYAVTKQWLLGKCGIPSRLCECVAHGERHLVVLVMTPDGEVCLDSLTGVIRPIRYPIERMQSSDNSGNWDKPA